MLLQRLDLPFGYSGENKVIFHIKPLDESKAKIVNAKVHLNGFLVPLEDIEEKLDIQRDPDDSVAALENSDLFLDDELSDESFSSADATSGDDTDESDASGVDDDEASTDADLDEYSDGSDLEMPQNIMDKKRFEDAFSGRLPFSSGNIAMRNLDSDSNSDSSNSSSAEFNSSNSDSDEAPEELTTKRKIGALPSHLPRKKQRLSASPFIPKEGKSQQSRVVFSDDSGSEGESSPMKPLSKSEQNAFARIRSIMAGSADSKVNASPILENKKSGPVSNDEKKGKNVSSKLQSPLSIAKKPSPAGKNASQGKLTKAEVSKQLPSAGKKPSMPPPGGSSSFKPKFNKKMK